MCIPHGGNLKIIKLNSFKKEKKSLKSIKRVSQAEFERGDPNFVDERISKYIPKKKSSFFDNLFPSK